MIDFTGDRNGAELARLSKLYTFPVFVKNANEDTLRPEKLAATAYANPTNSTFPCHTSAATWLSGLFFAEKRADIHPKTADRIKQRLDRFADHWGIKASMDNITKRWEELHKNADDVLPDSDFAVVWVGDDGSKHRHCRMKNAAEVAAAASWLNGFKHHLPFTDRNVIATKILEKAGQYGASLGSNDNFIEKQAGRGLCNPSEVSTMLRNRSKLANDQSQRDSMQQLAASVAHQPRAALTPDMLIKLAVTVDCFDRANNIAGKYTDSIPCPEDVIFRVTYKEARAGVGDAVSLTTGGVYDRTEFTKIALSDVKALFGDDFAREIADGLSVDTEKLAEQASALPRPDAELFEKLLDEAGIPPMASIKTARSIENAEVTATLY